MKYPCLKFRQRDSQNSPEFCIFHAPVGEVLQWAEIPRLSPGEKDGIQRARNDYKVRGIKKFFTVDDRNTIPTAIVITLKSGVFQLEESNGSLHIEITEENKQGIFVVDGQHRLYGLNEYGANTEVPIVAILDASDEEKAFQFIVINNKVSKVAPDHIRALTLNFTSAEKEQGLEKRLNEARLSINKNLSYVGLANTGEESPFKGLLALPDTPTADQVVSPAAIEIAIAYIQSKNLQLGSTEDAVFDFFSTIWATIKRLWPEAFNDHENSKLLKKVGIQCMTQYMVDNIDTIANFMYTDCDLSNSEDVANLTEKILNLQTERFWLVEWSLTISDTKVVRDQIIDSLRKIQQNVKANHPWNADVSILALQN